MIVIIQLLSNVKLCEPIDYSTPGSSVLYDLSQIPYDYTVEVRNRFKGLDLIDSAWRTMNFGHLQLTHCNVFFL